MNGPVEICLLPRKLTAPRCDCKVRGYPWIDSTLLFRCPHRSVSIQASTLAKILGEKVDNQP